MTTPLETTIAQAILDDLERRRLAGDAVTLAGLESVVVAAFKSAAPEIAKAVTDWAVGEVDKVFPPARNMTATEATARQNAKRIIEFKFAGGPDEMKAYPGFKLEPQPDGTIRHVQMSADEALAYYRQRRTDYIETTDGRIPIVDDTPLLNDGESIPQMLARLRAQAKET